MAARIGLATGKEWIVDRTVDQTASSVMRASPFTKIETRGGMTVYISRVHVAYVEEAPEVDERPMVAMT